MKHETPEYDAFLRRKVELRSSMRSGRGRSNDEVEKDFAAWREVEKSNSTLNRS